VRTVWLCVCLAVLAAGCRREAPPARQTGGSNLSRPNAFELETSYEFIGELMPLDMVGPGQTVIPADADPNAVVCFKNIEIVKGNPQIDPQGLLRFGIHGLDDYTDIAGPEPWGHKFLLGVSKKGGILMVLPAPVSHSSESRE